MEFYLQKNNSLIELENVRKMRGALLQMERKLAKQYKIQSDFSEILRKAYEKGLHDGTITVEKLIEDIKSDLLKMKVV